MSYETLLYEVSERILTLTLNRPDRLNAFNRQMQDELIAAIDAAESDDNIRAIIVTGSGRAFCAGADLEQGGDSFNYQRDDNQLASEQLRDGGGLVSLRLFKSTKPVIGAINGAAVGVGITMTLPMDIRIASDTARFGFVFSRRGLVPEACSSWFLPRLVGISQALEWVYSGRVFSADEALRGGLVREIVSSDMLINRAREIAQSFIDDVSPISVALSRQMLWRMLGADHPMAAHKIDSRGIHQLGLTEDVKEGIEAFLQKRAPDFKSSPATDMPDFYPWWQEPEFE